MKSLLTLSNITAATPDGRTLFRECTLTLGREVVAVVGRNGAGKSTLLRIASGASAPSSGKVTRAGSVGLLEQDWGHHDTVMETLGVAEAIGRAKRIDAGIATPLEIAGADWTIGARLDSALLQVGLNGLSLDTQVAKLSGGERTRLGLSRLILDQPDVLLLDEPTNNLDADARTLVSALMANWRGGVLVASHDRALLQSVDRIVELSPQEVRIVGGGWSAYFEQREAERERTEKLLEKAQASLRATTAAGQRRYEAQQRRDKAGRAVASKRSEPRILLGARAEQAENSGGNSQRITSRQTDEATARVQAVRERIEVLTPLTIALPSTGLPSETDLLALDAVTVRFGNRILGPWNVHMRGPERVALVGPNGVGKSTFLKVACGMLAPEGGLIHRRGDRIAMLDQHASLLDPAATVLDNIRRLHPDLEEVEARAACARFAFRNRDALRIVSFLSGGERLRAGLAATMSGSKPPWLLILDEPTNHLDLPSIEVLELSLRQFDGAILVVSHDAAFLDAIGVERRVFL